MKVKSFFVSNLRNLKPQEIDLKEKAVFLLGKNGQGKTSLLEAIFILSHLRSFRSSSLTDVITIIPDNSSQTKLNSAYIRAIVETTLGDIKLEVEIGPKKRELKINDKKVSSVEKFCGQLKTVLFTPEDLEIVKGAPQIRRQFLDRILAMLDPQVISLLGEYTKCLKIRNVLIKSKDYSRAKLFVDQLSHLNSEIIKKRLDLIEKLRLKIAPIYTKISGESGESFDLVYQSNLIKKNEKGEIISLTPQDISTLFIKEEPKEAVLGRTTLGCHKDELRIDFINEGNRTHSRNTSSQGQTRTKVLSIKLASAEVIHDLTKAWPILLLDDVEAELDEDRALNLRKEILGYDGQVFITGTSYPKLADQPLNLQRIKVENGIFKFDS